MNNILIVEDEHLIARLIEMTLTRAGYRCTLAEDGRTAADLIETTNFDMALLDIMLPGLDGYALLECLRPQGVPVIFITAKSAVKDRVQGLRLGADDYITKPFAAEELVARMETVLRRTGRGGRELCAYDVVLDTVNHTARQNGEPAAGSGAGAVPLRSARSNFVHPNRKIPGGRSGMLSHPPGSAPNDNCGPAFPGS